MDIRAYIEKETGLPTAETVFRQKQKLPFVIVIDKTDEDGDDYHAQIVEHDLAVEFYAQRIDVENEKKMEAAFAKQAWKAGKDRVWIEGERMFETIYTINFTEKRQQIEN